MTRICEKHKLYGDLSKCMCGDCYDKRRRAEAEKRNRTMISYLKAQHPTIREFVRQEMWKETEGRSVHFAACVRSKTDREKFVVHEHGNGCQTGGFASLDNGRATMHIAEVTCGNCQKNLGRAIKEYDLRWPDQP